jgi:hypothetical protein
MIVYLFNVYLNQIFCILRELYLKENLGLIGEVGLELFSLDFERDLRLAKFTDNADMTPLPLSCK